MTPQNFCYFLQGFLELNKEKIETQGITKEQAEKIAETLDLVFTHPNNTAITNKPLHGFQESFPSPQIRC